MNNIDLFSTLFYIGMAICILGAITAVVTFFLFDIPTVFAQVSGRGAKLMSDKMRRQYDSAKLSDRPVTEEVLYTNELIAETTADNGAQSSETNVLNASEDTTALGVASAGANAEEQNTTVLGASQQVEQPQSEPKVYAPAGKFELFENVVWIHTEEII